MSVSLPEKHPEGPRLADPVEPPPPERGYRVHRHRTDHEGQVEQGKEQEKTVERELVDVTEIGEKCFVM